MSSAMKQRLCRHILYAVMLVIGQVAKLAVPMQTKASLLAEASLLTKASLLDVIPCLFDTSNMPLVVHITNMVNRAEVASSGIYQRTQPGLYPISGRQGSCKRAASVWPSRHRQNPDWQSHCQQHQGHLLQHQRIFPDQQMDRAGREDGSCLVCCGWLHAACCHLCG